MGRWALSLGATLAPGLVLAPTAAAGVGVKTTAMVRQNEPLVRLHRPAAADDPDVLLRGSRPIPNMLENWAVGWGDGGSWCPDMIEHP